MLIGLMAPKVDTPVLLNSHGGNKSSYCGNRGIKKEPILALFALLSRLSREVGGRLAELFAKTLTEI